MKLKERQTTKKVIKMSCVTLAILLSFILHAGRGVMQASAKAAALPPPSFMPDAVNKEEKATEKESEEETEGDIKKEAERETEKSIKKEAKRETDKGIKKEAKRETEKDIKKDTRNENETAGTKIIVCVIDSGCNEENAKGNNYLGFDQDLTDAENHGTLIWQIIEETAPSADIYMLKCFNSSGDVSDSVAVSDDWAVSDGWDASDGVAVSDGRDSGHIGTAIQQALRDAVDIYHADLINMSWTFNKESEELHDAVRYAASQGAVLVASSGNLTPQTLPGSTVYPSAFDEVIGVSGADTDDDGEPADSLWYLHNESVFVSADGNFAGERGSSFAAPRVTGKLAQYFASSRKAVSMENAEEYLKSIAEDAGVPGYDTTFGWGFIRTD